MTANNTGNKIAVQYGYKQNVDVSIVGKCANEKVEKNRGEKKGNRK